MIHLSSAHCLSCRQRRGKHDWWSPAISAAVIFALMAVTLPHSSLADVSVKPNKNLIDLSWPFNDRAYGWIDFRNFSMERVIDGFVKGNDGQNVWVRAENIGLAIHSGTHIDAPLHFCKDKWSVDEIPVEHFVDRPLVVINAEHSVIKNQDYQVTEADFLAWEHENGQIPEGSVIFLRTGFSKFYSDRRRYFGVGSSALIAKNMHYPGLDPEAAEWIVRNRLIVGIGIDAVSLDSAQSKGYVVHQTILERNMYILENLNSKIDEIPVKGAKVHLFPMKIEGASGAPVRIVVDINSASNEKPLTALLTACIAILMYRSF